MIPKLGEILKDSGNTLTDQTIDKARPAAPDEYKSNKVS